MSLQKQLQEAVEADDATKTRQFLLRGVLPNHLEAGTTVLHIAADHGNVEILKELIHHKGDVNIRDSSEYTPLHKAVIAFQEPAALVLIQNGADLNAQDCDGDTPLHKAIIHESNECLQLLLQSGANINVANKEDRQTAYGGYTPLHLAIMDGHDEVAHTLINMKPKFTADVTGETPLHKAARGNNVPLLKALVRAGADTASKNGGGETAQDVATTPQAKTIVKVVTKKGGKSAEQQKKCCIIL